MKQELVTSYQAGPEIIKAMGLDGRVVTKIVVTYEAMELVKFEVTMEANTASDPTSQIVEQIKRYGLVELTDEVEK